MIGSPVLLLLTAAFVGLLAGAAVTPRCAQASLSEDKALEIATEAYIYGYPLVTMEVSRRVMTNVAKPENMRAPMGQLLSLRQYPTPEFHDVTTPNADTLYSSAWMDVGSEPYVLQLPDMGDRYFLMPLLDAWTDVFASPGTRTTGDGAQVLVITGPGFSGTLPEGVTELKSPTNLVWLIGRTYCTGTPEDYKAVHALQDQFLLVPLSAYGKAFTTPKGTVDPAVDMKTPVRDQVNALDAETFFTLMAELMQTNPPAAADGPILEKMAAIGLTPGSFDPSGLAPATREALAQTPKAAMQKIMAEGGKVGRVVNGWGIMGDKMADFGTDYLLRAYVTVVGLGANLAKDAVYPIYMGEKLSGEHDYMMHFDKGMLPPVKGFWSLTMYNAEMFFVANKLDRYTLSPRNDLVFNPDGSLDLYLQKDNPGKSKENNWLPAPSGEMNLVLRLYWPTETPPSVLDGSWNPPPVQKVK